MDYGEILMKTLFIGDSVTDCDRLKFPPLGDGWVSKIFESKKIPGEIINVGVSGNRLVDLKNRWSQDVLSHHPNILSIAIGINDTWRRYDDNDPTDVRDFESNYREVLEKSRQDSNPLFVLCEPFLLPANPEMKSWRSDLNPKISVIKELAADFSAIFVPFDELLNSIVGKYSITEIAPDGIHPSELGHAEMARLWLSKVIPIIQQSVH